MKEYPRKETYTLYCPGCKNDIVEEVLLKNEEGEKKFLYYLHNDLISQLQTTHAQWCGVKCAHFGLTYKCTTIEEPEPEIIDKKISESMSAYIDNSTVIRVGTDYYMWFENKGHMELKKIDNEFPVFFRNVINRNFNVEADVRWVIEIINYKKENIIESEKVILYNRVAWCDNAIWYNLTNKDWSAVKITENGWNIEQPPLLFNRWGHEISQDSPISMTENLLFCPISQFPSDIKNNVIAKYPEIVLESIGNKKLIRFSDEDDEFLYTVDLISKFIPANGNMGISHAIDYFTGPEASTKSTIQKISKKLVDPSLVETSKKLKDDRDLEIVVSEHWYIPFENLTYMSDDTSNSLCCVSTGSSTVTREYYTTASSHIFNFHSCVGLNSIEYIVRRPDLISRIIHFKMSLIPPEERISDTEVKKIFSEAKPYALGWIFDILSKAMLLKKQAEISKFRINKLPRMSDWAIWGYYIGEAIQSKGGMRFLDLVFGNESSSNDSIIESDFVAESILDLCMKTDIILNGWSGNMTKLLDDLRESSKLSNREPDWKGFPNGKAGTTSLGMRLNKIVQVLYKKGIIIKTPKETKKHRTYNIYLTKDKMDEMIKAEEIGKWNIECDSCGRKGIRQNLSRKDMKSEMSNPDIVNHKNSHDEICKGKVVFRDASDNIDGMVYVDGDDNDL